MRGHAEPVGSMFYVIDVKARIRADHPLRGVRREVDGILLDPDPVRRASVPAY